VSPSGTLEEGDTVTISYYGKPPPGAPKGKPGGKPKGKGEDQEG
jgi:serine/threonine-protein kinase